MVGDVDIADERHALICRQLAIGADAADMRAVAQAEDASAQLARPGGSPADRFGRHALAEAAAGVQHQKRAEIEHCT
jgi:hypothetical protein